MYTIIIPCNAVTKKNHRPIYTNRRTGKPFLGKSTTLRQAEEEAIFYCRRANIPTITTDISVAFIAYTQTRRRLDLANFVQLYEDAMEASGVIENDSQIRSLDGTRQYYDKENPRIEIYISNFIE